MQGLIVLVKNSRFESIKTQTIFGFIFSSKGSSRMGSEPWVRSNPPIFFHRDTNGVKDVMSSMRWCDGCHLFHEKLEVKL